MSKHMKRLAAPRSWKIAKKTHYWVPKTRPGPHSAEGSVPLLTIVRDYLKLCDSAREATRILGSRVVHVDGAPVTDSKRGVGFMDVVSIRETKQHYRVLLDRNGRLVLQEISEAEAAWKLCRIENKTTQAGGRTQLNLHDGRCLVVKETTYKTGQVLKLKVPEQKVLKTFDLNDGAPVFLTGGAHVGELATYRRLEEKKSPKPNLVHLASGETEFATIRPYAFLVGETKPEIPLPEVVVQ
ncbi:MAG: 30S ribosomal protein S4e [Methanobacteriota archaeon]